MIKPIKLKLKGQQAENKKIKSNLDIKIIESKT
jgi:hypothetical protein